MGRVSAEDAARFQAQPDLQAFVRPLVPGEFGDIQVASEAAMKSLTYIYVQRIDETTIARLRLPITEEQAQAFMAGKTLDVSELQAAFAKKTRDTAEYDDDPFVLPRDTQRLTIVAAASGIYTTFHDFPHLEHDQEALQERARQLILNQMRIWPEITNDVQAYTRLFVPAFLLGYRLGDATLQEMTAEKREAALQAVRSMDNPSALFLFDQNIRKRMQDMGAQTIYELI